MRRRGKAAGEGGKFQMEPEMEVTDNNTHTQRVNSQPNQDEDKAEWRRIKPKSGNRVNTTTITTTTTTLRREAAHTPLI